ncbi:FKBP-type peptidyl-prolyl cis-trans isomerase [Desulfurispira natronophila]|uniref:Peptidyl-prolyl cis-trans isomerase n=1 Tax=Desulfurispira natronophila TaxID=682562 RepID=A0A7W7Y4U6_9BACT|nr:peptidylprolyl isomerase [Desulfurispira natronophila]MBB5022118.1 FKBP-type peptidyl-prolyl cis-trans isomerase 2 [Desulfurispira natronophila]
MSQVKSGDTVQVHYTGTLEDGTVFDSSYERDPLEFTIGANQIIPGVEEAVVGMAQGEKKTFDVPSDKAYGEHNEEMVYAMDRQQLPQEIEPQVGMTLQASFNNGQVADVLITSVDEETVTLDANHPLAGKTITFEMEIMGIDNSEHE